MILVRDVFHCKFGMGDQVVAVMKKVSDRNAGPDGPVKSARIMTDISGRFFSVVSELEMESVEAHQAMLHAAFENPDFAQDFAPMSEAIESGHREYYTIEHDWRG